MNNATDNKTSHWPVRNEAAAADLQRTRDMPLLFQLADINRPAASTPAAIASSPAVAAPLPPAKPAPLEISTPSTFPLASSVLDSWPLPSSNLFEMPTGLSTAALAMGTAAAKEKEENKPAAVASTSVESPAAEKPAFDKAVLSSGLPAAIESAVKAAAETSDAAESKPAAKTETKSEAKVETKVEAPAAKKESTTSKAPIVETIITAESKPATKPAAEKSTAEKPADKPADKPSPASLRRQRAEARQAKVDGKGSDWLSTHGKVIAICFVLALLGTIYLARRNRGTPTPAPSIDTPNLAVEIPDGPKLDMPEQKAVEAANTAPRLVEAPSHPLDATPSPATPVAPTTPDVSNTAELQSPVVPNAGQTTAPPSSEPLFPWQNDPRMASRPDQATPASTNAAPTDTAPVFVPPGSNPAPTAPTLNAPTYPETNLRDAPLLPPAPPANSPTPPANTAPPTNNYPAPASGQGGSSGRVPASYSPASFTSAPGGNRYERTGSGLY